MALPTRHIERPHAFGAHFAERHRLDRVGGSGLGHGCSLRLPGREGRRLYWLTYSRAGEPIGVVIIRSGSLVDARMRVALDGLDDGVDFGEGHKLDRKRTRLVTRQEIGRMLSIEDANRLPRRLEAEGK